MNTPTFVEKKRAVVLPLFILLFILLFATGCARVIKEPVYIPTKCEITPPARPAPTTSTTHNLKSILIYTEQLERDLRFCTSGE